MSELRKSKDPFLKVAERCLPINEIVKDLDLFYQNAPGSKNAQDIVVYFMQQFKEIDNNFMQEQYKPQDAQYINIPTEQFLEIKTFKDFCDYLQSRYNLFFSLDQSIYEVYCSRV